MIRKAGQLLNYKQIVKIEAKWAEAVVMKGCLDANQGLIQRHGRLSACPLTRLPRAVVHFLLAAAAKLEIEGMNGGRL